MTPLRRSAPGGGPSPRSWPTTPRSPGAVRRRSSPMRPLRRSGPVGSRRCRRPSDRPFIGGPNRSSSAVLVGGTARSSWPPASAGRTGCREADRWGRRRTPRRGRRAVRGPAVHWREDGRSGVRGRAARSAPGPAGHRPGRRPRRRRRGPRRAGAPAPGTEARGAAVAPGWRRGIGPAPPTPGAQAGRRWRAGPGHRRRRHAG